MIISQIIYFIALDSLAFLFIKNGEPNFIEAEALSSIEEEMGNLRPMSCWRFENSFLIVFQIKFNEWVDLSIVCVIVYVSIEKRGAKRRDFGNFWNFFYDLIIAFIQYY